LQRAGAADVRVASRQRSELALAEDLPAAAVIVADTPGASLEQRVLHAFQVAVGDEEAQLVHRESPDVKKAIPARDMAFLSSRRRISRPTPARCGTCAASRRLPASHPGARSSARRGTRAPGAAS